MIRKLTVLLLLLIFGVTAYAGSDNLPKGLKGVSFEGLYYLQYQSGTSEGQDFNMFKVGRAYLTAKKKLMPFLSSRITLDAHQDEFGDMKVRVKYAYAHFKWDDFGFITRPNLEAGIVHMPWLDFEEHLNYYRMQGKMFMERSGLFNSADFGVTFAGFLGGELDNDYKKRVNKKYAGRYGSFAVGVYNGGGYHAGEKNTNKMVETRLTVRPLPDPLPGLQVSYFGAFGEANVSPVNDETPAWMTQTVMLSYEHQYFVFTGQFLTGKGNQNGSYATLDTVTTPGVTSYDAHSLQGFSLFSEGKLGSNWRIIGAFDSFDPDTDVDDNGLTRMIIGGGYDFGHHNVLLVDYESVDFAASGVDTDSRVQVTMQIKY